MICTTQCEAFHYKDPKSNSDPARNSSCLKNVTLVVKPPTVMEGQDTTLQCFYDLEGIPLYSVKWYRGRHEFYRFSPSEHPSSKIFPIPGIDVDVSERTAVRQAKFQFQ
ncbi:hypothetical protein M8J77_014357 [Diaphorina citri]|nr:hypothetical protein M8J77_014357 [Diaphorina citri]